MGVGEVGARQDFLDGYDDRVSDNLIIIPLTRMILANIKISP